MRFLGIDIGGTNIKCVTLSTEGEDTTVVDLGSTPTPSHAGPVGVREAVVALIERHRAAVGPVQAVGLTVPGTVDVDAGTTGVVPNIPGDWAGFEMAGPIARAVGLPVALINDARAFSIAEATAGAARGLSTVVCVTLGTGIGGGVVIGGELHSGHTGLAGEIGHQTVDASADAPLCGCGGRGCLEALASADALCALAGQPDVAAVFAAARAGDPRAVAAVEHEVRYLAIGLANAYMLLCPDAFVIGGGIAQAGEQLRAPLLAELRRRLVFHAPEAIQVRLAELGPKAGAIGAALWARTRLSGQAIGLARSAPSRITHQPDARISPPARCEAVPPPA
jgi:glucokinase